MAIIPFLNNAYFSAKVGIGTDSPDALLKIHQTGNGTNNSIITEDDARKIFIGRDSIKATDLSNNAAMLYLQQNGGNATFGGSITATDFRGTAQVYLTSPDSWLFRSTGGSERMRLNSAGNLGINTTNPGVKLDVNGQIRSNNEFLLQTGTTAIGSIRNQSGALDIRSDSTRDVSLGSVTSPQALFIEGSNGNVGIGTTSPDYKLDVEGSANNADIAIRINNTFDDNLATSNPTSALWLNAASNNGYLRVYGAPANTAAKHQIDLGSTAGSSFLTFSPSGAERMRIASNGVLTVGGQTSTRLVTTITENDKVDLKVIDGTDSGRAFTFSTSNSERMRITAGGNVGIGATAPLRKLHVAGGTGFAVNASTSQYYGVYIPALGEGADPRIDIGDWHNAGSTIKWDSSARSLNLDTQYSTAAGTFNITGNDGASTFLTILPSGNVGIGTTTPGAKLDVQPTASNRKVTRIANDVMSTYFYNTQVDAILAWTCGSYYQAEVVITANQTNGGDYNNLYIRGIWSNNHTSHHWDELEHIGSLTGSTFTMSVGQNGSTTASGRLELDFNYISQSFSQLNVRVTDFFGTHSYTIT